MSRLIKASAAWQQTRQPIQLKSVMSFSHSNELQGGSEGCDPQENEVLKKLRLADEAKKNADLLKKQAVEEKRLAQEKIAKEEKEFKQRIEEAFKEAKEKGYTEGYSQGQVDGKASYDLAMEEAQKIIRQAKDEYQVYLEKAEPVILDLALAVANRIIYTALDDKDGTWLEIVKNAVQEVKEHEEVIIYVPISRYEETKQHREEIESLLRYTQDLIFMPDTQLKDGACFIETPYGRVDASLDSQLRELKTKLEELLKEEHGA